MGIIDSVSLKRGSSEFGWTYQNLPTCIDVDLSIKDMSPMMYMAMKDSVIQDMLGTNNTFNEYMLTLAGTGLFERISRWSQIRRDIQLTSHKIRNQVANPMFWANKIADSAPAQFISALSPWSKVQHS
jgi:predicted metal-binding transcription factor (methanogenesis marker protein 9)